MIEYEKAEVGKLTETRTIPLSDVFRNFSDLLVTPMKREELDRLADKEEVLEMVRTMRRIGARLGIDIYNGNMPL